MHPGGYNHRPNTAPYGAYGYRNGSNAPPYRHHPPPPQQQQQQLTPQEKEEILLTAGRFAAEYLVSTGELPARVLHNRPPPPLPFQQQRRPAPPFLHERPLATQRFQHRPPAPAPRQFQQQRPPFAPRPFQGQGRPIAKRPRPPFHGRPPFFPSAGARGSAAPAAQKGRPGQGAEAPAATKGGLSDAPAGDGSSGQPVAPPSGDAGTAQSQNTQTMDHQANQG
nr:uncharacterized protein LOC127310236 [Lolium perenne]